MSARAELHMSDERLPTGEVTVGERLLKTPRIVPNGYRTLTYYPLRTVGYEEHGERTGTNGRPCTAGEHDGTSSEFE